MPIARYKRQTVSETGNLNQKIDVKAPQAAFQDSFSGRNVEEAARLGQEVIKMQDSANQLKALTKQNEFKKKVNDFLHNPETGALYTKGLDAIAVAKKSRETINPILDQYRGELNDMQKTYFDQYASSTLGEMDSLLNKHLARESMALDQEQTKSFLENEKNSAIMNFGDLNAVENSVDRIKQEVVRHADRNGISAEGTKLAIMQAESETRAGVIRQYIDSENPKFAKEYYETYKDKILPEDRVRIEKAIDTEVKFQLYQDKADSIVGQAQDQVDALNRANSIEDAEERKEVKQLVRAHFSEVDQAERQRTEDNYLTATNLIEQAPGLTAREVIPPTMWAEFSLSERKALTNYAQGGSPSESDLKTYYRLEQMASMPQTKNKFLRANLLEYKDKLSKSDFGKFSKMQAQLRAGQESDEFDGITTKAQIVNNAMNAANIPYGTKASEEENKRANLFRSEVDELVIQKQKELGRKLNNQELRDITQRLTVQAIKDRSWFNPMKYIEGDDVKSFEIKFSDVPDEDVKKIIEAYVVKTGRNPTKEMILKTYQNKLFEDERKRELDGE